MRVFTSLVLFILLVNITTSTSANQIPREVIRIGRGAVHSTEWRPDGEAILINTVNGVWLYTADLQDLAHLANVHLATFSPDGRYLAGAHWDGTVGLWDAMTFAPRYGPDWVWGNVWDMAWSPDGQKLAISGTDFDTDHNWVVVWNPDTFEYDIAGGLPLTIYDQLAWSPGGSYLAMLSSRTSEVYMWNDQSHESFSFIKQPCCEEQAGAMWWQDDNHLLHIVGLSHLSEATLWNVETGSSEVQLELTADHQPQFSPDGDYIGVLSPQGADILEADTGEIVSKIVYEDAVLGGSVIDWYHDGSLIAGSTASNWFGYYSTIWIADPLTGEVKHEFQGHRLNANFVMWSPDGQRLLSIGEGGEMAIHDLQTDQTIARSEHHSAVNGVIAWNTDSKRLAVGDTDDGVSVWDITSRQEIETFAGHEYMVQDMAWQPNGDVLATHVFHGKRLWLFKSGHSEPFTLYDESARVEDFAWNRDGTRLAYAVNGTIFQRSLEYAADSSVFEQLAPHPILQMEWSIGGDQLAASGEGVIGCGMIAVWDVSDGDYRYVHHACVNGHKTHLRWTDKGFFMWFNWQPFIHGPQLLTYRPVVGLDFGSDTPEITQVEGLIQPAAEGFVSSSGRYIAAIDTNEDGLVWERASGEPLYMLGGVTQLYFSPDETRLAIKRLDGTVWVLDATTGRVLYRIPDKPLDVPQHYLLTEAPSVVWSPDNRYIAHVYDGTVAVWDVSE